MALNPTDYAVISQALETLGFGPIVVPRAELVFPKDHSPA